MDLAANFERKCRICGTDILDVSCGIPIFGEVAMESKILKYLYVKVQKDDELPKNMCATCYMKIESIDKFSIQAIKMQDTYSLMLQEEKFKSRLKMNQSNSVTIERIVPNGPLIFKQMDDKTIMLPPKPDLSVISYSDLKLGLLIKDQELLKLILKALKWAENDPKATYDTLILRLKNTSFREVISNHNLLNDSDLMQLLKCYVGQEAFLNLKNLNNNNAINLNQNKVTITPIPHAQVAANSNNSVDSVDTSSSTLTVNSNEFKMDEESITQMEVGVDPDLFLPYDDDQEAAIKLKSIENEPKSRTKHVCNSCPETFATNTLLQEHVVTAHLLAKQKSKPKNENKPPEVTIELKKIEKPPVKIIIDVENLIARRRRRQRGEGRGNRFVCTICKKKLSTKGNLKVHLDTHKPKGKYTCDRCDRIFKTSMNLVRHKQYHGGEQFSCRFCGRVYPTNSTLKAHMITHSDIRPHKCPMCEKTFKRNQDLKFHLNQHTGNRPYTCPYCPKSFASSGNCFSHRKRMHSAQVEKDKLAELKKLGLTDKKKHN